MGIKKKRKGGIDKMLPIMIGMGAAFVISIMYISYMKQIDLHEDVAMLAREYILRMESDGYLTDTAANNLVHELIELGGDRINLSGTTFKNQGYGKKIMLCISLRMPVSEIKVNDLFNITTQQSYRDISIKKVTTSKN